MKFLLLICMIGVLTFIAIDGSPLPKEDKSIKEGKATEKNSEEDSTDTDVETNKEIKDKTKSKSTKDKNEKSTPEPIVEEEENQFYIMVPAGKHAQKLKPFNFNRVPKMPFQPKYAFKQPNYPTFPYPMFQQQDLMEPETELEYSIPNIPKMTNDLPIYYIPMRKGQFANEMDEARQIYKSPFIFQDGETNPWNTYLENPGYFK